MLPDFSAIANDMACRKRYYEGINKKNEAQWILFFTSLLLGNRPEKDEQDGVVDLPILHDLYMMSLKPQALMGMPEEVSNSDLDIFEKISRSVRCDVSNTSYMDGAGGMHLVDIAEINRQVWKEKLLQDIEALLHDPRMKDWVAKE